MRLQPKHKSNTTKMLGQMCTAHLLESSGHGRGTKYHIYGLNMGLQGTNMGLQDANMELQDANMGLQGANMGLQGANMGLNVELPDANVGLNVGLQKKRYSKEEMRSLIVSYCSEWRTAEEIAVVVGRKFRYVRDIILPQLSDVIEKMYNVPHHPRQKYRAKQKESEA